MQHTHPNTLHTPRKATNHPMKPSTTTASSTQTPTLAHTLPYIIHPPTTSHSLLPPPSCTSVHTAQPLPHFLPTVTHTPTHSTWLYTLVIALQITPILIYLSLHSVPRSALHITAPQQLAISSTQSIPTVSQSLNIPNRYGYHILLSLPILHCFS